MPKHNPLYDPKGKRKFITREELHAFLDAAHDVGARERTFCLVLAYTGCQIREALHICAGDIDLTGEAVFIGHDDTSRRGVPLPSAAVQALDVVHGVRRAQKRMDGGQGVRLWPVDRATASRWVARVMRVAGIEGPCAGPRGLRSGFAVQCIHDGVPVDTLQRWMGYSSKEMAELYATADSMESG